MTWVRVDDKAMQHPKLVRAGAEGVCLWLAGLCHCNAFATDGRIHKDLVPALYSPIAARATRIATRLVELGLWIDDGDSYAVHDYQHYQHAALKEEAEARLREAEEKRRRERTRKAAWRASREGTSPGHVPPDVPDMSHGTTRDSPTGQSMGRDADVPRARVRAPAGVSRPDPTRPDLSDQDLGGLERSGEVAAVLDGSRPKTPPPPIESRNVTPEVVSREWHRIGQSVWNGRGVLAQPTSHHRESYEVIAAACNATAAPTASLAALLEYFWTAPHGPIASRRITRPKPSVLAEGVTDDLAEALAWKRGEASPRAAEVDDEDDEPDMYKPYPPMPAIPVRAAKESA